MYLLEAFKRHGVHFTLQKLSVKSVYVGFETRDVYLSTVLSLHFVPGMKHRPETQPISLTVTRCAEESKAYSSSGVKSRRSSMWSQTLRRFTPSTSFFASGRV